MLQPQRYSGGVSNDFEPTTDFPEFIDEDDAVVASGAAARDEKIQTVRKKRLRIAAVVGVVVLLGFGYTWWRVLIAVAAMYGMLSVGINLLGAFARPIPEAPPAGELRKVKLTYRCSHCGSEIRMTLANDQVPEAPRHCTDDMELTTNLEDVL